MLLSLLSTSEGHSSGENSQILHQTINYKFSTKIKYRLNSIYNKNNTSMQKGHSQLSSFLPMDPRTVAAFPLCTATEILCRRNSRLRGSPVAMWRRLSRSCKLHCSLPEHAWSFHHKGDKGVAHVQVGLLSPSLVLSQSSHNTCPSCSSWDMWGCMGVWASCIPNQDFTTPPWKDGAVISASCRTSTALRAQV